MPKISEDLPIPSKPSGIPNTVANRIRPVGKRVGGIKIVIYGETKTGKTRLASTFPKPMLLIGTEDGTASISNVKGIDFIEISSTSEIEEIANDVLSKGKYKTVGLDTAGGLQGFALKEHMGFDKVPISRTWGMVKRKDWVPIGNQTKERLATLLNFNRGSWKMNVVIIAHERSFNDSSGEDEDAEVSQIAKGPSLTPGVCNWLCGECDYVCETLVRRERTKEKVDIGDGVIIEQDKIGDLTYSLRLKRSETYIAGFRIEEGRDKDVPEFMSNPTYQKIKALIDGPTK